MDAGAAAEFEGAGRELAGADAGDGEAFAPRRERTLSARGAWRQRAGLAVRERLPVWLQARCAVERRSVVALALVLAVAVLFAAQYFRAGRTQAVRPPEVVGAAGRVSGEGDFGARATGAASTPAGAAAGEGAGAVPGAAAAAGSPGAEIVVDVGGKVRRPGVQRLPAGSRVADALRAAGGVRPGVGTDGLNRARFLVDGEQVLVGASAAPGTVTVPGAGAGAGAGAGPGAGSVSGGGGVAGAGPAAPVALSTATVDQLDTLPGVGPVLAQHIVDYRTQHGGFRSVNELREVNGIGDRRFADLRDLVRP